MKTIEDLRKAESKMLDYEGRGNLIDSARIGCSILRDTHHMTLIEIQALQCSFKHITHEEFYRHVIVQAKKIAKEFHRT